MPKKLLRFPALAVKQGDRTLYSFAVDGKQLSGFTTVSRVHRDEESHLAGYQRPEALAHIRAIKRYIESADAILPNALVVAFDKRARFKRAPGQPRGADVVQGELVVPVNEKWADEEKPGWVVDGQQRSAALREANVKGFPVFVTAFITDSVAEQRSQFILVNSTKPLPKGLIHELLPSTPDHALPIALLRRRYPALLLERLNFDEDSPLRGMIRTPTTVGGTIKDNSILKMLSASLEDGALYAYFDSDVADGDTESMLTLLKAYWESVAQVFPEAWHETPRRSRLVHGVGIMSMGALMDEISYALGSDYLPSTEEFQAELQLVAIECHWMTGSWRFSRDEECAWNELQNTPQHVLRLTDHLLSAYRRARPARPHSVAA